MASISAAKLASEVLEACLRDGTWPSRPLDALIERALDEDEPFEARAATRALFGILVETLADLFEPSLCDVYAKLFSHVIARALPEYEASDLLARYRGVRQLRHFPGGEVRRAYVLSRVTLGADVAVTSVAMNAMKHRFPDAEVAFVGPEKNADMFADDPKVIPVPVAYGRSSLLRDRLSAAVELQTLIDEPGTIVIDPDSRLTQLGLIPVCDDARYYFFESRGFGGELQDTLPALTAQWLSSVFEAGGALPYVAPRAQPKIADITVSLGVGENRNKRIDGRFEHDLLCALLNLGKPVLLDRGAGGEEAERVDALAAGLRGTGDLRLHDGPYASFASHILQSRLYVGYDSAGQHVADAGGIPLVSVFAGFTCQRMFERWRPRGPQSHVVRIDEADRASALDQTLAAISAAAAVEEA